MFGGINAPSSLKAYLPTGHGVPVFIHVMFGGNLCMAADLARQLKTMSQKYHLWFPSAPSSLRSTYKGFLKGEKLRRTLQRCCILCETYSHRRKHQKGAGERFSAS